jgi:hypothetical protein
MLTSDNSVFAAAGAKTDFGVRHRVHSKTQEGEPSEVTGYFARKDEDD